MVMKTQVILPILLKVSFIRMPYGAIPKMIEAIHFNDNKYENKNIILPNKNDNKIKIFKNNKWIYTDKNNEDDLIDNKYFLLDNHYDLIEQKTLADKNILTNYIKFRNYYDKKDKEMIEQLRRECELVILNNR